MTSCTSERYFKNSNKVKIQTKKRSKTKRDSRRDPKKGLQKRIPEKNFRKEL